MTVAPPGPPGNAIHVHQLMNGVAIPFAPRGKQVSDGVGVSCHGRRSRGILSRQP